MRHNSDCRCFFRSISTFVNLPPSFGSTCARPCGTEYAREHAASKMENSWNDEPKSGEPATSPRERIMLVEDEVFVRGVTQEILESAGYSVIAARDANEAQRMFEENAGLLDLLLTDIVLPGGDGRRLAKRLLKTNSALQILLVTGYEDKILEAEDGESVLQKPFAAATLLHRVRQLLDHRPLYIPENDDAQARLR